MNILDLKFPELPSYKATSQTVYLSPMSSSEEKFAIGIIIIADPERKIIPTISDRAIQHLFGKSSTSILNMIKWIMETLNVNLSEKEDLYHWIPPFNGVTISPPRLMFGRDFMDIFNQSRNLSSIFGQLNFDKIERTSVEHWFTSVKTEVLQSRIDLKESFDKTIAINYAGITVPKKFNFVKNSYISSFVKFSDRAESLMKIQSKIFELELLQRDSELINNGWFETVIGLPSNIVIPEITMLEKYADESKVFIYPEANKHKVANHILLKASVH